MIKHITFTGIDANTDFERLQYFQYHYPLAEFGVLVSKNWQEKSPRYLNPELLPLLKNYNLNLSIHVCGAVARSIIKNLDYEPLLSIVGDNISLFKRMQLNVSGNSPTLSTPNLVPLEGQELIIQQKNVNNLQIWDSINNHTNMSILLDASGGNGIDTPIEIHSNPYIKIGYAGGINPENVHDKLSYILQSHIGDFWIDMESGVRTNDWLDLDKVKEVLEISQKVIEDVGND